MQVTAIGVGMFSIASMQFLGNSRVLDGMLRRDRYSSAGARKNTLTSGSSALPA